MRRIKLPPLANLLIGIAVTIYSLYRIIPMLLLTISANAIMAAATPIQAKCTDIEHGLLYSNISFTYEVNGQEYEATLENQTLGEKTLYIGEGDEFTVYVNNSDPTVVFMKESVYNDAFDSARNKIYIRNIPLLIAGLITVGYGAFGLIQQHREKKADRQFREAILSQSKPPAYTGMYSEPDIPPQPVYSDPGKTSSYENSSSSYNTSTPSAPSYGSSSSPYSSEPSDDGYTSLDFSHLPPSKPMTINDEEFEVPKTIEPDDNGESYDDKPFAPDKPFSSVNLQKSQPAPSEPNPTPVSQQTPPETNYPQTSQQTASVNLEKTAAEPEVQTPSAPIDTTDLSSIIKRGSDDPFNINADDYEVDPALAALIKKGSDDPFKQNADSYEVDPSLAAIIKSGGEDPFANIPKKDKPKRKKKRPQY